MKGAALVVSVDPEDQSAQTLLADALATHLNADHQFMDELLRLLGGTQTVQEILADRQSSVEDVTQKLKGTGRQSIKASEGSTIRSVQQSKE